MKDPKKKPIKKKFAEIPVADILMRRPLVEVLGNGRLMIENHRGIIEYSNQKICVKVTFGCIKVCGNKLIIAKMTSEQMVIVGEIQNISWIKRES